MHGCWCKYERSRSRRKEGKEGRKERREGRKRKVLEKLINASLVERVVAKNGRAISTGSRGNFSTNTSRKAHRLGNADNCIPPRSHSWWKSSVHGGNGVWGCGGRIPAEINSERRGIHRLSLASPRKPFSSNYFANIAKRSRQASSSFSSSPLSPRVPINSRYVPFGD